MGVPRDAGEIPLLPTLFYLFHELETGLRPFFWTQGGALPPRSRWKT